MSALGGDLAMLQLLRVKGTDVREAVEAVGSGSALEGLLADGFVAGRAVGGAEYLVLTPAGEAVHAEALEALRGEAGFADLGGAYERDFLPLNAGFKELCAQWQLVDDRWPLLERLLEIDAGIQAFLALAVTVSHHYARYRDGLAAALAAVEDGDVDALVAPVGPSYHNLWFELHEDLLALLGRSRADEAETR